MPPSITIDHKTNYQNEAPGIFSRVISAARGQGLLDGTGKDYDKINRVKKNLDTIGYDSYMIFVNTSLEVALERNEKRARKLPEDLVKQSWNEVQRNIGKFQGLFGVSNLVIVDNNKPDEDIMAKGQKGIKELITKPIQNGRAKQRIAKELEKRKR